MSRLKVINGYLPTFPGPENTALDEGMLIDVLVSMCTDKWRNEMIRSGFEPADHTIDTVQSQLELPEIL